jgi:hypothetical protein
MRHATRPAALAILIFLAALPATAQEGIGLLSASGRVDWPGYRLEATISLNVAKAGLRLPSGRSQAESMVRRGAPELLRDRVLGLPLDSRRTVADAIVSGDLSLEDVDSLLEGAEALRSSFSDDLKVFKADYAISLLDVLGLLVKHSRPSGEGRTLAYQPTKDYTGIVIYAPEKLPVHGSSVEAVFRPSFFPRIWDDEMDLVLERNMVDPESVRTRGMVGYKKDGADSFIEDRVGGEPLRILARGIFGSACTDLVISREDAQKILSSEHNRGLFASGRVVIVAGDVDSDF